MNKIPSELYTVIYDFYTQQLSKGVGITKIYELFNAKYKTKFPESSLRNKYEEQRDINNVNADLVNRLNDLEEAERKVALAEMELIAKQKKIQRQQSAIDSQLRYNADKELVAEIFKDQVRDTFKPIDLTIKESQETHQCPIYNLSDLHLGYMEDGYYDLQQAKDNLINFFRYVNNEIKENGLSEVIISETGDMIEGSTLRATQLFTIAEVMTKQATIYIDLYTRLLKQLSKDNPDTQITVYFVDEDNHSQIRLAGAGRGDSTEQVSKVIANDIRRTVETAHEYGGLANVTFTHASEIFAEVNGKLTMWTHAHQYPRDSKQMLNKIYAIHGVIPDVVIRGHYHTYLHESRNVVNDFMQVTITAPSAVGDTRYGREGLGLTGLSGVMKITIGEYTAISEFIKL